MKALLARHVALIMKIGIALSLLWVVAMLAVVWYSGSEETRRSLLGGKRFIIHIADGRVEGAPPIAPAQQAEAKPGLAVPPPPSASEEESEEVPEAAAIQASSNPIPAVSDELLDKSSGTPLPVISAAGAKPWQYYSKTFRRQNELPLVAIIITGLGQNKREMEIALGMDDRIGLSFVPYASAITSWTAASRLTGHEMYVELPLQAASYPNDDPGPYSILAAHSNTENLKNLAWAMSRFQGYVGLVAPPGEVITNNVDTFAPLLAEIAPRGLMYLVGRDVTLPEPGKKDVQPLVGMHADIWIDEELTEMSIQARLATLEQVAQRNGVAIGIARSVPLSMTQIKHWHETLGSRGIVLAPASFIAKLKYP